MSALSLSVAPSESVLRRVALLLSNYVCDLKYYERPRFCPSTLLANYDLSERDVNLILCELESEFQVDLDGVDERAVTRVEHLCDLIELRLRTAL